jgi:hypothetical protein
VKSGQKYGSGHIATSGRQSRYVQLVRQTSEFSLAVRLEIGILKPGSRGQTTLWYLNFNPSIGEVSAVRAFVLHSDSKVGSVEMSEAISETLSSDDFTDDVGEDGNEGCSE